MLRTTAVLLNLLLISLFAGASSAGDSPPATVTLQILASSGQPSPDGNGVFGDQFGAPLLNNSGELAFFAALLATTSTDPIDDLGLYRAAVGELDVLARGGQTSAAGNLLSLSVVQASIFTRRPLMGIASDGSVAFLADDSESMDAVYRADGNTLQTVLQVDQNTPFADNLQLGPAALGFLVNDNGQLAYQVQSNPLTFLVRSDGLDTTPVFTLNQALPDNNVLTAIRAFGFNNNGEVVARLNLADDRFGHFVGDTASVRLINQTGAPAPDGMGTFTINTRVPADINNLSDVALVNAVDDVGTDYTALYVDAGAGLEEQIRTGDATVGGSLLGFIGGVQINDLGDLLYNMISSDNNRLERLILRSGGAEQQLAAVGSPLSDDIEGTVVRITGSKLNESGQVLLSATLQATLQLPRDGLYLFDPRFGFVQIVETGQELAGGNIQTLSPALPFFPFETNTVGNAQTGFNDQGQVAFAYSLDTLQRGVVLADVVFDLPDLIFKDSFETSTAQ